jgi:two-component system, NarL family, response regulator LiaR
MTNIHLVESLTPRQAEVLRLIAQGKSNKQIADELIVSLLTVQNHVHQILAKLQARNRTAAAVYAVQVGLVSVEIDDLLHAGF